MLRLVALALLVTGCGGRTGEIRVTLISDSDVSDALLASVRKVHAFGVGVVPVDQDVPVRPEGLMRTERLLVELGTNGTETLSFSAYDASDNLVACSPNVTVDPANLHDQTVHMGSCTASPGDGGVDLALPDDSGLPDLAGLDQQPPDGGVLCPASAIFCDDFESGNLSKWIDPSGQDGTATADSTQHYGGSFAYQAHVTNTGASTAYKQVLIGFNAAMTFPLYVRVFMNLGTNAASSPSGGLIYLEEASSTGKVIFETSNGFIAVASTGLSVDGGSFGGRGSSTAGLSPNTWYCVEWMVDGVPPGQTGGSERVSLNGVDVTDLHVDGVQLNALDNLTIGWTGQVPAGQSMDVWYDDVAVAHSPMGCP